MGSGVGFALGQNDIDVITCLRGRSNRTRQLAAEAHFRDIPTLGLLVEQADLILSILVPDQAVTVAQQVAAAMRSSGKHAVYAECNAVSPQTTRKIESIITKAGGQYVDGGIIGGSPTRGTPPRFYVSGEHTDVVAGLDGKGITVKPIGKEVGRASGIKMCYAALTKGTSTLQAALLSAAESMNLTDELIAEFEFSQPDALRQMNNGISRLPPNAHRWIGEMLEIASTFEHLGVTPSFHQGAAEMYRLLSRTPYASEAPENADKSRPTRDTIRAVVDLLQPAIVAEEQAAD
jgi:3-hydroxyisobutyrate dehydrogenase-like beta-hydroxyacid dehydrogenase